MSKQDFKKKVLDWIKNNNIKQLNEFLNYD